MQSRIGFRLPMTVLAATLLGLGAVAQAQLGGSVVSTSQLPALQGYRLTGRTLLAPDGTRITLSVRGQVVTAAQVVMPNFDAQKAGVLLGALSGYGSAATSGYTQFLTDPGNQAGLLAGQNIGLQDYVLTHKLGAMNGKQRRFTLSLTLPEVPASTFVPTKNAVGPAAAKVVVRIFSDFQCPYCEQFEREAWPALKQQLSTQLGGDVRYEFHQFPLEQLHPNARAAAEASECAAQQGQFWAFHDTLFDPKNWQSWTPQPNPNPAFISYASNLKLDMAAFKECLAVRGGHAAVEAGLKEGAAVGVNGTPTVYVNGYRVSNPYDPAATMQLVKMFRSH